VVPPLLESAGEGKSIYRIETFVKEGLTGRWKGTGKERPYVGSEFLNV